jgi:Flp pilus assembly protein TadG
VLRFRRRRGARGQALAEFALIAPILFLLLFGVIQIGLVMGAQNGLVNGVRDATRKAATYRVNEESIADASIFAAVCDAVSTQLVTDLRREIPGFDPAALSRTIRYEFSQDPNGAYFATAHVTATFANPIYIPLVGAFFPGAVGNTLPLTASEQMRIENPDLPPPVLFPTGRSC